jgi:hypothetical protein
MPIHRQYFVNSGVRFKNTGLNPLVFPQIKIVVPCSILTTVRQIDRIFGSGFHVERIINQIATDVEWFIKNLFCSIKLFYFYKRFIAFLHHCVSSAMLHF